METVTTTPEETKVEEISTEVPTVTTTPEETEAVPSVPEEYLKDFV